MSTTTVIHPARLHRLKTRLGVVVASHGVVDVYAALVTPLIGVLQVRCELSREQAAWLLGIGSLTSGLCQPFAAWLSDRLDTRIFGPVGMAVSALCLCSIGLAHSFSTLLILYMLGMIGSGVFHPTGASSVGHLADQLHGRRRSLGVSVFYVAGMSGSMIGAMIAREVAIEGDRGFDLLMLAIGPGLLLAVLLHKAVARVTHHQHHDQLQRFDDREMALRWWNMGLLYAGNALRSTVNMALVYLVVRWAEAQAAVSDPLLEARQVAEAGGRIAATINVMLIIGMGMSGLTAGLIIRQGREKWPMVLIPILFAPAIAMMGSGSVWNACVMAALAGVGFSAMAPVTISLAQRLLPHRTGLASSLMLGGAWAVAVVGPRAAEWCLSDLGLSLPRCFELTAILLAVSGLMALPMSASLLKRAAVVHPSPE